VTSYPSPVEPALSVVEPVETTFTTSVRNVIRSRSPKCSTNSSKYAAICQWLG
jgi:hypothetical protein